MRRSTPAKRTIYDKLVLGAVFMLAAEILAPVPLVGPIIELMGFVL